MYPLMEREFDRMLKKAMPYLILSPNSVRDNVADYMKSLYLALRNNNEIDFDLFCTKINEVIANSNGCIDSYLECNISDFNERWSGLDESIAKIKKELIDLKKDVSSIKKKRKEKQPAVAVPASEPISTPAPMPTSTPSELPKKRLTRSDTEQKLELLRNYLKTNREIDNPKCREICGVNKNQAKELLQKLVKENFVEQKGKRRGTKYVLGG